MAQAPESVKQGPLVLAWFIADTDQMRCLHFLLALLATLLCTVSPASAKLAKAARPALWRLADADTTLYLFGTIHLLPEGAKWRTPALDSALDSADILVLEVGNLGDPEAIRRTFMSLAMTPGLPPVRTRVAPRRRAALVKLIATSGAQEDMLNQMENWAVATTVSVGILHGAGLSAEEGVEATLRESFEARRKPVIGIETTEDQLRAFDSLSAPAQLAFLNSVVDEVSNPRDEFDHMYRAWASGKDKAIAKSFDAELKAMPEIGERLIKGRNANWVRWIKARLTQPGTIFIAVGAGHLAGKDSVQTMLGAAGLKVERIQ